jgi:hypothetical protein
VVSGNSGSVNLATLLGLIKDQNDQVAKGEVKLVADGE